MARVALSLDQLLAEVNALGPGRNKASDGAIGDAAHAKTWSDHNANAAGVICARDITHDPDHGVDGYEITERMRLRPHKDVKYVLWQTRMWSRYPSRGIPAFTWRPYSGPPHVKHWHTSVGVGLDGRSTPPYDDTDLWLPTTVVIPPPVLEPQEIDMPAAFIYNGDLNAYSVEPDGVLTQRYYQGGAWHTLALHGNCRKGAIPETVREFKEKGATDKETESRIDVFAEGEAGGLVHAYFVNPGDGGKWRSEVLA